jgi:hypothetical protein
MTTVTTRVHFRTEGRGRRVMRAGSGVAPPPPGRVPRVARLMALAIRFERLITDGGVNTQAELAELGHVTRARVTQIMNLLHLAPDIQEQILDLPVVVEGRDPITERDLRPIAAEMRWHDQRSAWNSIAGTSTHPVRR